MAILNFVRIVCLFLKQEREKDCLLLLKQKQEQEQKPAFKKRVPEQFDSSASVISQESQTKNKNY